MAYRISHFLVRTVCLVNIVSMVLDADLLRLGSRWYPVSSLLLPIYVALERWWMTKTEGRPIFIDAVFAAGWFLVFWVLLIHTLYRNGFPWL